MKKLLLITAAFSLMAISAPLSASAQSVQLQGSTQPTPDSPLYNLQKGQVTTNTQSAEANVEAYPSDGSQSAKDGARAALANPSDADEHHDRNDINRNRDDQSAYP